MKCHYVPARLNMTCYLVNKCTVFSPYNQESELKYISAHFDTKLSKVSKILLNITRPKIDTLQRAYPIKIRTPLSVV